MLNLRAIRERNSLTQRALAIKAKMSITYLCNVEQGKANPSLNTIRRLAKVLKVNPKALIPSSKGGVRMRPRLDTYKQLERAVEKVGEGKITRKEAVERILLKCFTNKMLRHKGTKNSKWDPNWQNGRGAALELVRNLYRYYDL